MIEQRWCFKNTTREDCFRQFIDQARRFIDSVDACYESTSAVEIHLLKSLVNNGGSMDVESSWDDLNRHNVFATLHNIAELSKEQFERAVHITIFVCPTNDKLAPVAAFAVMDSKNRHLDFFVQPTVMAEQVRKAISC